jgi:hypothetical protein
MRYLIKSSDQISGPFTSKQLRELASSGKLSPDDQIREESDSKWRPASKFKGLFDNGGSKDDAEVVEAAPRKSRTSKTRRSNKRSTKNPLVIGAILLIGIVGVGAVIRYLGSEPSPVAQKPADPVEQQPIAAIAPAKIPASSTFGTNDSESPKSTQASLTSAKTLQQEWAEKLKMPVEYVNSRGTQFVLRGIVESCV